MTPDHTTAVQTPPLSEAADNGTGIASGLRQGVMRHLERAWSTDEIYPDLFAFMAECCGWHPLKVGEEMTVSKFGKGEYLIKRLPEAAAIPPEQSPNIREDIGLIRHNPITPTAAAEAAEESVIEYLSGWPMTTAQIAKDFIAQDAELTTLRARVKELESTLESFRGAAKSLKVFGRICCRANELAATHTQPQTPAEAERSRGYADPDDGTHA
jgi:hypothetical protein